MSTDIVDPTPAIMRTNSNAPRLGWVGIGTIALVYATLYAANFWLPLSTTNYTTRIWGWSQLAITLVAGVIVLHQRHLLTLNPTLLGLSLATLSALSHAIHDPSIPASLLEGGAVWVCFLGGVVLFQHPLPSRIPAFPAPLSTMGRNLALGVVVALPLALVNNLYFIATVGAPQMQHAGMAALEALSPAIHEEIIFRFFLLALCLTLLKDSAFPRLAMSTAIILAVVPHSLNHLPDVFLHDPSLGGMLLVATSVLFGLPMALLQIRRSLETAIAFHWWIDFTRFLLGF